MLQCSELAITRLAAIDKAAALQTQKTISARHAAAAMAIRFDACSRQRRQQQSHWSHRNLAQQSRISPSEFATARRAALEQVAALEARKPKKP